MYTLQRMYPGVPYRGAAAGSVRRRAGSAGITHPGTTPRLLRLFLQCLRAGLPRASHPTARPGKETVAGDRPGVHQRKQVHSLVGPPTLPGVRGNVPFAAKGNPTRRCRSLGSGWTNRERETSTRAAGDLYRLRDLRI